MDTEVVAVFCLCDDMLKAHHEDQQCQISDGEVMTIAIVAALYHGGNFELARKWLQAKGYIPNMLGKSCFNRRLHRIQNLFLGLFRLLGETFTPKAAATMAMDAVLQRRKVELQRFEAKDYVAKVSPSDADLEEYYKANESAYRLPEQAQIEYVMLDLESVQKGVSVSDDELRRYYAENAARYTAAEERRASHILIKADRDAPAAERQKARARAEELLVEVRKAPGRFAQIAAKNSQDPGSAAQGGDLDFFGRGAMVKGATTTTGRTSCACSTAPACTGPTPRR